MNYIQYKETQMQGPQANTVWEQLSVSGGQFSTQQGKAEVSLSQLL
jgi:hypothetical protein